MYTLLCMCVYLVIQSYPTLCDPVNCAPGSFIHGILQVRILEWVAISFSRGSTQPRDRTLASCIASKFFTVRGTREASNTHKGGSKKIKKKKSAWQCRGCGFDPWVGQIPWRRKWQPTPIFLLGNPTDRRAWQATVHAVTKSRTWLSTKYIYTIYYNV